MEKRVWFKMESWNEFWNKSNKGIWMCLDKNRRNRKIKKKDGRLSWIIRKELLRKII